MGLLHPYFGHEVISIDYLEKGNNPKLAYIIFGSRENCSHLKKKKCLYDHDNGSASSSVIPQTKFFEIRLAHSSSSQNKREIYTRKTINRLNLNHCLVIRILT